MPGAACGPTWTRDRKSTRLNSSHEWSSYAVVCLKKNNRDVGDGLIERAENTQRAPAVIRGQRLLDDRFRLLPEDSPLFFFNDTATTEIYTLSLHDALPI